MNKSSSREKLNIYFAGSIRGGRGDAALYATLIQCLQKYGRILTEHVGNEALLLGEKGLSEEEIYTRDMRWMTEADLVIAEVTTPSLGVGYELAVAEKLNIPTVCLFRANKKNTLSAMIRGNPFFHLRSYKKSGDAEQIISHLMHDFQEHCLS